MELTEEKLESMLDRKFATLKQSLDEVVNTSCAINMMVCRKL